MVTGFIVVISLVVFNAISLDVLIIVFIRLLFFVLESTLNLVLVFGSKTSFSFTHSVVESSLITVVFIIVVVEDFSFLVLAVSICNLVDDFFLFHSPSLVLHVVHVELVLEVVDVGVFLNIDRVETL
jgi:hypothetical protein